MVFLSSCAKQKQKQIQLTNANHFCNIYKPIPDSLLSKIEVLENLELQDIKNLHHNEMQYLNRKCDDE